MQVEDDLRLRLGTPTLLVSTVTTTFAPTLAPEGIFGQSEEEIWRYIFMLSGLVLGLCTVGLLIWCWFDRRRLREETRCWHIAHPGVPFPHRRGFVRKVIHAVPALMAGAGPGSPRRPVRLKSSNSLAVRSGT